VPCKKSYSRSPICRAVLDGEGKELTGNDVEGVLAVKTPWPGIARTVWGDHDRCSFRPHISHILCGNTHVKSRIHTVHLQMYRYLTVYMRPYPGFYFTGDGCRRDADDYIWITGTSLFAFLVRGCVHVRESPHAPCGGECRKGGRRTEQLRT
jgi:acyl-coenzyme A synthetase/AMP-(fatty) acid ligase